MNSCVFLGNLVFDPERRQVGEHVKVSARIAVRRSKDEADFLDLIFWDKQAETLLQYLGKGDPILVRCEARQETWEDKNGGGKRSAIRFHVREFRFVGGKNREPENPAPTRSPPPARATTTNQDYSFPAQRSTPQEENDDDDIPF